MFNFSCVYLFQGESGNKYNVRLRLRDEAVAIVTDGALLSPG